MRGAQATGDDVLSWDDFNSKGDAKLDAELDARLDALEPDDARDADLHLGHHRSAQGRDAVARQPRVDRAAR